ncbi:MAG: hypothetical protein A2W22_03740 [Candidatus Levybacteria bacterium RBG_16_35_11]|nr:MAG: hypothetical protein A2W22_03740 [Candidatus Levybacteria bacterium RBG_16_35_11]
MGEKYADKNKECYVCDKRRGISCKQKPKDKRVEFDGSQKKLSGKPIVKCLDDTLKDKDSGLNGQGPVIEELGDLVVFRAPETKQEAEMIPQS